MSRSADTASMQQERKSRFLDKLEMTEPKVLEMTKPKVLEMTKYPKW